MSFGTHGSALSGTQEHPIATSPRILIAEDDDRSRRLVAQIVTAAGIGVIEAVDGQHALELLEAEASKPEDGADSEHTSTAVGGKLIGLLIDIDMPRVDGMELVRRLRADARWRDVPIAMVTALANPQDESAAWIAGCDYFLRKPVVLTELRGVLRAMLVKSAA